MGPLAHLSHSSHTLVTCAFEAPQLHQVQLTGSCLKSTRQGPPALGLLEDQAWASGGVRVGILGHTHAATQKVGGVTRRGSWEEGWGE